MKNFLKNKWDSYSNLGVLENMTISLQKKVILTNQLALFFFIIFTFFDLFSFLLFSLDSFFTLSHLFSLLSIFSLLTVPLFNKYNKVHITAFLISTLTPFFTLIFSIISTYKSHDFFLMYFSVRIFLIVLILIPFIVIDKSNKILLVISVLFIVILLYLVDPIYKFLGIEFDENKVSFSNYYLINYIIVAPILILLFGFIFLTYINTKYESKILHLVAQLKENNYELEVQKQTIQEQFNLIEIRNNKITDSIYYAKGIQNAFLPNNNFVKNILKKYFLYYKPKDIVSGDFYWINEIEKFKIIIAADCTGHGVPGAFLSVLGITLLNDIILIKKQFQPDLLLNELRNQVKIALNQFENSNQKEDGMDISVCIWNFHDNILSFSGAYNSICLIRNNKLFEYKADKQPIGKYFNEKMFSKSEIQLQQSDLIYLYTDGFASQFGGKISEKLSTKRFKDLILNSSKLEIEKQTVFFESFLENWQNTNEQTDDILILSFQIV